MKYNKFTPEENEQIGNSWVKGHTGALNAYVFEMTPNFTPVLLRLGKLYTSLPPTRCGASNSRPCFERLALG
jgi:hypothetical protein